MLYLAVLIWGHAHAIRRYHEFRTAHLTVFLGDEGSFWIVKRPPDFVTLTLRCGA